jgi:hypothetical protein
LDIEKERGEEGKGKGEDRQDRKGEDGTGG